MPEVPKPDVKAIEAEAKRTAAAFKKAAETGTSDPVEKLFENKTPTTKGDQSG